MYQADRDRLITNVLSAHYYGDIARYTGRLSSSEERDRWSERLIQISGYSWSGKYVIEVGFGRMFRSMQELFPDLDLEKVVDLLVADGWVGGTMRSYGVTLDIVYAWASDPGPPFDRDTDYAIVVVPNDMRGKSPASRFYKP